MALTNLEQFMITTIMVSVGVHFIQMIQGIPVLKASNSAMMATSIHKAEHISKLSKAQTDLKKDVAALKTAMAGLLCSNC